MKLDQNYSIENDTHCWILKYKKVGEINPKTGKTLITKHQTYHGDIGNLLRRYCDNTAKNAKYVGEILDILQQLHDKIDSLPLSKLKADEHTS